MRALVAAIALIAAAPLYAQSETRATINLATPDPNSLFNFTLTVTNTSSAVASITMVRFAMRSPFVIDSLGTISPPATTAPSVGSNNDGNSAAAVTITPVSPLLPGQAMQALTDTDLDPAGPLTPPTVTVRFDNGTELATELALVGGTWNGQVFASTVPTYPIELTWEPPTQNEDGSPYLDPAGYKLYWGAMVGTYGNSIAVPDPATVMQTVQVPAGAWYFVATAVNSLAIESEHSNVATGTVGPTPVPPNLLPPDVTLQASGLAWMIGTLRNQIVFVEAGTVRPGAPCDLDQTARGTLPTDQLPHSLNLVLVDDVTLLPGLDPAGELALFAECID
jgi:hypothetical protein